MAEGSMAIVSKSPTVSPQTSLDYVRCASTGAFANLSLFVLCWIGAAVGITAVHGFVALFTDQPTPSGAALLMGGIAAFVAGALAGFLVAHCYNIAGRILAR